MGTNYYISGQGIVLASAGDCGLHIGKKSAGWAFLFRSHPDMNLTSVEQWRRFVQEPGRVVVSEYGERMDTMAFFAMATRRPADEAPGNMQAHPATRWGSGRFHQDLNARGVPFLDSEFV